MEGKYYDIPFQGPTALSDFACKDGEIEKASGVVITSGNDEENTGTEGSEPYQFIKDFSPELPPAPEPEFALKRSVLTGWHLYPDAFPAKDVIQTDLSPEGWGKTAKTILKNFMDEARNKCLLVQPLLMLAVWRLKSGGYISPSSPQLLIPDSEAPTVTVSSIDRNDTELKIAASLCRIVWRIRVPETMRDFIGRISSLEIMISRPLQLYDPDSDFIYTRRYTPQNFSACINEETGMPEEKEVCTVNLDHAWLPQGGTGSISETSVASLTEFFSLASIPLGALQSSYEFRELEYDFQSLNEVYTGVSYTPSYAMFSLKSAKGGIFFKGKTLLWSPELSFNTRSTLYSPPTVSPLHWFFIPDPEKREFRFTDPDGIVRSIPLTRHPRLWGSYFWGGLRSGLLLPEAKDLTEEVEDTSIKSSSIWLSDKSDPPVFEDSGLQDLECGSIKALCRAFRASGLIATVAPTLYVFTDEGIFLCKENSSGIFSEAGLIARYFLKDIETLMLLPQGIRFLAADGSTVTLKGTSVSVMSINPEDGATGALTLKSTGEEMRITTRPIKLSGAGRFKRLHKAFLRGNFNPSGLSITISGSRDMRHWYILGRRKNGAVLFLNPIRGRFFRVEITGETLAGHTFEGISLFAVG